MVKYTGGKLSVVQFKKFIDASPLYPNVVQIDDYYLDRELSNRYVQVYYNPKTKKAVVCHRQTTSISDWAVDVGLALGIKAKKRFGISEKTQAKAERKYGPENVTTIGYSLGGLLAEEYGKNSHEIITYNKAAIPSGNQTSKKQFDIRSNNDIVSYLSKFQKGDHKTITIPSNSYNIIKEHKTEKLNELPQNLEVGHGHVRNKKKMTIKQLKEAIKILRKQKKAKGIKISGMRKSDLIMIYNQLIK